jgi:hypothetical protein
MIYLLNVEQISTSHEQEIYNIFICIFYFLSKIHGGFFPEGKSGRDIKMATRLYLLLKLRRRGAIPPFHSI